MNPPMWFAIVAVSVTAGLIGFLVGVRHGVDLERARIFDVVRRQASASLREALESLVGER